jgi:hypothetical protein
VDLRHRHAKSLWGLNRLRKGLWTPGGAVHLSDLVVGNPASFTGCLGRRLAVLTGGGGHDIPQSLQTNVKTVS